MGMFDTIKIKVKCPYCGNEDDIDVQNKQLTDSLRLFKVGDSVSGLTWFDNMDILNCIADCRSKECIDYTNNEDGYVSGFGRIFYVDIKLCDDIITEKYFIADGTNY